MKNQIRSFALILVLSTGLTSVTGCHKPETHEHATQAHETPVTENHAPATALHLNNGQKWPADKSTWETVSSMQGALKQECSTPLNALALAKELQNSVNTLIRECRMQGEAHEQLHVWLTTLLSQIKILQDGPDDAALENALTQIRNRLKDFETYFELAS